MKKQTVVPLGLWWVPITVCLCKHVVMNRALTDVSAPTEGLRKKQRLTLRTDQLSHGYVEEIMA